MQSALHAYNENSKLVSNVKGMFIESLNAGKVTQVSMVNPFRLNGIETQGFPLAKPLAPFQHNTRSIK